MKKLLYIILLLPLWVNAQTNGTIQKTSATGTIRGSFGSLGLDTLVNVNAPINGFVPVYNSTLKKSVWTNPTSFTPTISFGTFGSTPNAQGGSYSGGVITLQPADGTNPGGVTTGTQTFAGLKTFTGDILLSKSGSPIIGQLNTSPGGSAIHYLSRYDTSGESKFAYQTLANTKWEHGMFAGDGNFYIKNLTSGSATNALIIDASSNITLLGTISSTPQGTLYGTATGSITSAQLATSLTDETGTGSAVFSASPTFTGTVLGNAATFGNLTSTGDSFNSGFRISANPIPVGESGIQVVSGNTYISGGTAGWGVKNNSGVNNLYISNAGAVSLSGAITSTLAGGTVLINSSGGTSATQMRLNNTGGDFRLGIESSAGASIQVGTSPYAAVFGNQGNYPAQITTNGTLAATFAVGGDFTIVGSNATKASGTAWINPSDLRLKMNVGEYSKGLAEVLAIKPKTWYFNQASGFDSTKKHLSPIAQELQKIMPEMVSTYKGKLNGKEQELLQVDASDMTWLLVKAIQEQQAIIEKLNARITVLENK